MGQQCNISENTERLRFQAVAYVQMAIIDLRDRHLAMNFAIQTNGKHNFFLSRHAAKGSTQCTQHSRQTRKQCCCFELYFLTSCWKVILYGGNRNKEQEKHALKSVFSVVLSCLSHFQKPPPFPLLSQPVSIPWQSVWRCSAYTSNSTSVIEACSSYPVKTKQILLLYEYNTGVHEVIKKQNTIKIGRSAKECPPRSFMFRPSMTSFSITVEGTGGWGGLWGVERGNSKVLFPLTLSSCLFPCWGSPPAF